MKLSLWMIWKRWKEMGGTGSASITEGPAGITTFSVGEPKSADNTNATDNTDITGRTESKPSSDRPHTLFIYNSDGMHDISRKSSGKSAIDLSPDIYEDATILTYGDDRIIVPCTVSETVNQVADIFRYYNSWEVRIHRLILEGAGLQSILDAFTELYRYPAFFAETDGTIVAICREFGENDLDDSWYELKTGGQVPMHLLARANRDESGEQQRFSHNPHLFFPDNGMPFLGMQIVQDGHAVLDLVIREFPERFTPDIYQVCTYLADLLGKSRIFALPESPVRTKAAILQDLMNGLPVAQEELDKFYNNEVFCFPWQMLVLFNPGRNINEVHSYLLGALKQIPIMSVPLLYEGQLLIMVREQQTEEFLHALEANYSLRYYHIGVSLPFHSLRSPRAYYEQALFACNFRSEPGIRYCSEFGLYYLLHILKSSSTARELIHPALYTLEQYDRENQTDLYPTLHQFLMHDKNYADTAACMFVHRNSVVYRVNKIRQLTGADLEDPVICEYLRLSYLIRDQ